MKPASILSVVAASVALGMTALGARPADAANRYAVIVVDNKTGNATIGMSTSWGGSNWESYSLSAGFQRHFCWKYSRPDQNQSPKFFIKYDADAQGGYYEQEYRLPAYAAPDCGAAFGHRYVFRYETGRYIELYDTAGRKIRPWARRLKKR